MGTGTAPFYALELAYSSKDKLLGFLTRPKLSTLLLTMLFLVEDIIFIDEFPS